MSNSIPEIEDTKLLFIFGYNGADSHPAVARRIVRAKQKGAKIIVTDPRVIEAARIADIHLQIKGGTNQLVLNTLANVMINEGLCDEQFIAERTKDFEEFKKIVEKYTPEYAEPIIEVPAELIRQAAREYANAETAMILYGMGVTQFRQAVDVVKTLANIAMMTGNLGKPNTGICPVRGQNNVQGACDMGALPVLLPGYQAVADENARRKFAEAWGVKYEDFPAEAGNVITKMPERVLHETNENRKIRAFYVMGEDPAQSDPDLHEVRAAFNALEFVVVQDIFMNKTATFADVVLPATSWGEHEGIYSCSDRGFQRHRKAIEPKGDVKTDWDIICRISTAMGYPMKYNNTKEIWDEVRSLCPSFKGATYEKIERQGSVQWPCRDEAPEDTGTPILHVGKFTTADGLGLFHAAEYIEPGEKENAEYPFTLTTVREVGHYSARTMTGNCRALVNLEDEPGWIEMNVNDCDKLGVKRGDIIRVKSRRGNILTRCKPTERIKEGSTCMTYQWWIGACNELTTHFMDPISSTPEYKYCAINLEKIDDQKWAENQVKKIYNQIKTDMRVAPERRGS